LVNLNTWWSQFNNHDGWLGGTIPPSATDIRLNNNALDEPAVNGILVAVEANGTSNGTLYLDGGTNAVPTGAGLTAYNALVARGWDVKRLGCPWLGRDGELMSMRVTIATPEVLRDEANQLALATGLSEADVNTFGEPKWEDADGHLYSVSSGLVSDDYPQVAASDLTALCEASGADQVLAEAAQAAVSVWVPEYDEETGELVSAPPKATPANIVAIIHPNGRRAVEWMGLTNLKPEAVV